MSQSQSWEAIAERKRAALADSIPNEFRIPEELVPPETQLDVTGWPKESGWFTEQELEITRSTATHILQQIASRAWTSETVTRAFCKRAAAAQQLINCLSDAFFEEGIQAAKVLDEHLQRTGQLVGPLHGLPISLKDNFDVEGKDSTVGFASLVDKPAKHTSTLVEALERLGAVRYCKTNVPTAMMIAESVNNVFGRTVNPLNRKLTSGGSSGGESALIAFGGSPLGVGTDIGGSLRIPAACTGLFTIRPSAGRFPTSRCTPGLGGQEAVNSVNGPLAKTLDDMILYCKTVANSKAWRTDSKVIPIPWREVPKKDKLKIAVLWDDGMCQPTPPVARALKETVARLKSAGHEVVEWEPTLHRDLLQLLLLFFTADGGKSVEERLTPTGEPYRPEMQMYKDATELGVFEMWKAQLRRNALQQQYLAEWVSKDIDAILAPTTPYATVPHGKFGWIGYTGVYNLLDYSAVSFPTGIHVDKAKDVYEQDYKSLSEHCQAAHDSYDAQLLHGMPVSLQLVANRLEEEKALAMTGTILQAISEA